MAVTDPLLFLPLAPLAVFGSAVYLFLNLGTRGIAVNRAYEAQRLPGGRHTMCLSNASGTAELGNVRVQYGT